MLDWQEERSSISCLTAFLDLGIMHEIVSWLIRKTSDIFLLNLIWFIFSFPFFLHPQLSTFLLASLAAGQALDGIE